MQRGWWILATLCIVGVSSHARAAAGGPDAFGYSYVDSNSPGGPVFSWTDLAATGTEVSLTDDDSVSVSIGFDFSFYGQLYDTATIQSNGALTFQAEEISVTNSCLLAGYDTLIAPYWDDLNPATGGNVYYELSGSAPDRIFTVHWREVPHYSADGAYDVQVVLHESSGEILLQFNDVTSYASYDNGISATVGIEGDGVDYFLEYSCNDAALTDGLAIRFSDYCEGEDLDQDGYKDCSGDCNDTDPDVNPGQTEIACNDIDDDCDDELHPDEVDEDGDGFDVCHGDCDDDDATALPGGIEVCDGSDNDCNGAVDEGFDGDGDGYASCMNDCDDTDPDINPGQAEVVCNQVDDDCDNALHPDEVDDDGDGYDECTGDCDDTDPDTYPWAAEVCDGEDDDCNGTVDDGFDQDGDGHTSCAGDCDDSDPAVNPGETETACNAIDDNCDGSLHEEESDDDGDGVTECDGDCDDAEPLAAPGFPEVTCDGLDNDCDAASADEPDDDGDGASVCTDCDDGDPTSFPGGSEVHDGADNDCDGMVDEGVLPAGALVITELMVDPDISADAEGEWFELHNATAFDLNLNGLQVGDLDADSFLVTGDVWVPAQGYAVLVREGDEDLNGGVDGDYTYDSFVLANVGDELVLTFDGMELDQVVYDNSDWPLVTGAAMSLDPASSDPVLNDTPGAWCAATVPYGFGDLGTPGEENPACCPDVDGDGFADLDCGGSDCNDADADVHPDATELDCDDVDNDCDGLLHADEVDDDGDGWDECDGDCDDAEPATHPDADEVCDGVDNNCDQAVDDVDADGDGHAPPDCGGEDCDDGDAEIHPEATESCDDGVDNDCDGAVDAEDDGCDTGDDDTGDDDTAGADDDDTTPGADCQCRTNPSGAGGATAGLLSLSLLLVSLARRRPARCGSG
jgi:hypothetical protein